MQAENELALAAEDDRGTQAANSLRRELRGREGPDPLEESNSQVPFPPPPQTPSNQKQNNIG